MIKLINPTNVLIFILFCYLLISSIILDIKVKELRKQILKTIGTGLVFNKKLESFSKKFLVRSNALNRERRAEIKKLRKLILENLKDNLESDPYMKRKSEYSNYLKTALEDLDNFNSEA